MNVQKPFCIHHSSFIIALSLAHRSSLTAQGDKRLQFTAFGGAAEVGASCLLLQVAGKNILLDAGIRVNRSGKEALPDLD